MIITRLTLGLGNNLFQYALGRRLALERDTELLFSISDENHSRRRHYLSYISKFNMAGVLAKKREIIKIKLFNSFSFINPGYKNSVIKERGYLFDPEVIDAPKDAYLVGYWQSEKYFKPIENILWKDLTFKEPQGEKYQNILDKITRSNSVSVHVRRGDYLLEKNLRLFTTCTPDYYLKAEALISKKDPPSELFIFSDDVEWVKQNIPFRSPFTFVSGSGFTDYQELMLMSACKHNIIANSTYSWWGAWLNNNIQKIVVTPQRWFIDPATDERDLIPPSWIKL